MSLNDIQLYKEALSACGWSIIKTDELAELRTHAYVWAGADPFTGRQVLDLLNENDKLRAARDEARKTIEPFAKTSQLFGSVGRDKNYRLAGTCYTAEDLQRAAAWMKKYSAAKTTE